ncbi:MAG: hypothetical protein ACM3TT_03255 [Syntrophothermus sp.]
MKKVAIIMLLTFCAALVLGAVAYAEDKFPQGCVSCHKVEGDKDYSLSAEIQKIKGHPPIKANDPKACMACHKEGKLAFKKVIHPVHLNSQTFGPKLGGNCLSCHAMATDGTMSVKGL